MPHFVFVLIEIKSTFEPIITIVIIEIKKKQKE